VLCGTLSDEALEDALAQLGGDTRTVVGHLRHHHAA